MKTQLSFLVSSLCIITSVFGQTVYEINDPEELEDLSLISGDEVVLANGTYSSDERITIYGVGSSDNPIVFRAEDPGGVIFDNGLQMLVDGADEEKLTIQLKKELTAMKGRHAQYTGVFGGRGAAHFVGVGVAFHHNF